MGTPQRRQPLGRLGRERGLESMSEERQAGRSTMTAGVSRDDNQPVEEQVVDKVAVVEGLKEAQENHNRGGGEQRREGAIGPIPAAKASN
jgi:hypothetical protein